MWNLIAAVAPFALSMSVSPGPNNVMVAASGANYGFRRTLPHMAGITVGFPIMLVAIGLGMGSVFEALPQLHNVLKYAGAAYLVYLAYLTATAGASEQSVENRAPLSFLKAALFQWVNPKAWLMAVTAVATYTTAAENPFMQVLAIASVFAAVAFPSVAVWTLFGTVIARWLRTPRALRAFNVAMALLLVASLIPVFIEL